jgi:hypothetical protein
LYMFAIKVAIELLSQSVRGPVYLHMPPGSNLTTTLCYV